MANIIKEKDTPFGKQYIVYEANGGMKTFSTREEAEAYQPTTKDPADNAANDLVFTALTLGANGVGKMLYEGGKKGLTVAGQAMTPSTWIGGISGMAGYEAPTALLNGADLAYSAYLGKQAGDAIAKDGLNLETGINAALSLAPFTRSEEAIKAVAGLPRTIKDIQNSSNVINKARLAYEMNKGIKGAQFTNRPVGLVTNEGLGNMSPATGADVGTHFADEGSPVLDAIQKATGRPFVRTGTWTYTNNTEPIFVLDKGNWTYSFNPDIYKGVNPGVTPMDNAMALNEINPNYSYSNKFEGFIDGKQYPSYMTVNPEQGFHLSKNIQKMDDDWLTTPIKGTPGDYILKDGTHTPTVSDPFFTEFPNLHNYFQNVYTKKEITPTGIFYTTEFIQNGVSFRVGKLNNEYYVSINEAPYKKVQGSEQDVEKYVLNEREKLINSLPKETQEIIKRSKIASDREDAESIIAGTELGNAFKESIKNDIGNFYLSDEYLDRFAKSYNALEGTYFTSEDLKPILEENLNKTLDLTQPWLFKVPNRETLKGSSRYSLTNPITNRPEELRFGINTYGDFVNEGIDWDAILFHEFGHNIWRDNTSLSKFIREWNTNVMKDSTNHILPKFITYNPPSSKTYQYLTDPNEVRQRIMTVVRDGYNEGITEIDDLLNSKSMDHQQLKRVFKPEYLKYLLQSMLGITGLITVTNDKNN